MKIYLVFLFILLSQYAFSQCPEGSITSDQNLVVNGDFEEKTHSFESDYIAGKSAEPGYYSITNNAARFSRRFFTGKGTGYFMAVDGSTGRIKTVWKQTIFVEHNTHYFFSCWVNTLNIETGQPAILQFSINGKLLDKPFNCPDKLNTWKQFSVHWHSEEKTEIVIRIVSQNPHLHGNDFGLDRIKFYKCTDVEINIEENKAIVLRNVLFETNSAVLLETSCADLEDLVHFLSRQPSKKITISGYTDNVGSTESNLKL